MKLSLTNDGEAIIKTHINTDGDLEYSIFSLQDGGVLTSTSTITTDDHTALIHNIAQDANLTDYETHTIKE